MPGMCFWWKKLVLFYPMATFKHLSKQARCWLEQTKNALYVFFIHSASHRTGHFPLKPPHCINQLLTGRGSSSWTTWLLKQPLVLQKLLSPSHHSQHCALAAQQLEFKGRTCVLCLETSGTIWTYPARPCFPKNSLHLFTIEAYHSFYLHRSWRQRKA